MDQTRLKLAQKILGDIVNNAYRVLGVPAGASQSDVHDAAGALRRASRLGAPRTTPWDLEVLGPVGRSDAEINDALGRIRDPERRLRERLFWFQDARVAQASIGEHAEIPAEPPPLDSGTRASWHDRALQSFVRAGMSDPEVTNAEQWSQVLRAWADLTASNGYWDMLARTDARAGFEPAATSEEVQAVRSSSLALIAEAVAVAAATALDREDRESCRCALKLLNESLSDRALFNRIEAEVLGSLGSRLEQLCERISAECGEKLVREQDQAAINKPICEAALARFYSEVQPLLDRLWQVATAKSAVRRRAQEAAAMCLYSIAGSMTWADEFVRAEDLQKTAQALVPTDSAAQVRIEEGLRRIEKSAHRERVWRNLKPIESAPSLYTINGLGCKIYGATDYDPETDSYLTTHYLVALFIPIIPLGRYRVINAGAEGYRFMGRAPLRRCDWLHLGIVLALAASLFILPALSSGYDGTSSSGYHASAPVQYTAPNPPDGSNATSERQSDGRTPEYSPTEEKKSRIEAGRSRIHQLEARLDSVAGQLENLKPELELGKGEIERYEQDAKLGLAVDRNAYRRALNAHNSRVREYNSLLAEGKRLQTEYEGLLQHVNNLIDEYNRGANE